MINFTLKVEKDTKYRFQASFFPHNRFTLVVYCRQVNKQSVLKVSVLSYYR